MECLNVQSARNTADLIKDIVINHDIDILSLTETWLTMKDKDDFHVKGLSLPCYEFNHTPRHGNHGYGDVAVLHKASIENHKNRSVQVRQLQKHGDQVQHWITLP